MMLLILLLIIAELFNESKGIVGDTFPFRNVSLNWSVRVDDLISRLTPHEMIDQMTYAVVPPPIPRLDILPYPWGTECLRGDVGENSTGFPQAINLASTWNKELVKAVANATAYEVHAHYNQYSAERNYSRHRGLSCFSPVINIMRHPLWGRNQETYGECPYLSGMFAIYFVHGLQGPPSARYLNTNAGCKHFDVHNGPENIPTSRFSFDVKLSEFDWRSTFLPAFHACVNAGSYGIMCSYNSINGVPSCGSPRLLTSILRIGMNFSGYVISDDDAVKLINTGHHYVNTSEDAAIVAVKAGVNLELADPQGRVFDLLHNAYDEGKVDNETLIKRMKPLIYTRMRLGEFDPPEMNEYTKIPMDVIQCELHRTLARQATLQSFVLLKNYNKFLPIRNPQMFPKVLFLGPMANNSEQQYGDYAPNLDPSYVTTPLSSLQNSFTSSSYNAACLDGTKCLKYNHTDIVNYLEHNAFDLIILSLGTGQDMEREGYDRASMDLPNNQSQLLEDVLHVINHEKTKILLLIMSASPLDIQIAQKSEAVQAIIQLGFGAQELGEALKTAIIGDGLSKFGRLPYTWPKNLTDLPGDLTNYDMTSGFTYRYFKGEPLYPFGYGLSYSTFTYSNLTCNGTTIKPGDSVMINFNVKNSGDRVSDEIVQIYLTIHLKNASLTNVSREQLVSFDRLSDVQPSQTMAYQATVKPEQMSVYIDAQGFVIIPATLEFKVGSFIQPYLTVNVVVEGEDRYVGEYISYASI